MACILAIQPDPEQAGALRHALDNVVDGLVVVVDSTEAALNAIDEHVPDLVLVHALMPPSDDEHLAACLCALPNAHHVQTIRIPHLRPSSDRPPARLRLGRLRPRAVPAFMAGCDPHVFAGDVVGYLSNARAHKLEIEESSLYEQQPGSERRRARRWSLLELPWVSSVRLAAGERADLIDISAGGALLRSYDRPKLPSLKDRGPDSGTRPGLTLHMTSGEEVRLNGHVIRCQAGSFGDGAARYEVALRFDESVDLYLPSDPLFGTRSDDYDMPVLTLEVPPGLLAVANQWGEW